ncbi:hypothetical protein [Glycomyces sp. YM15]|uniref:hypothetical protein n=1 Tax=Glycomyces sp. YM15 TaxID=2800446 RepID=UPI001964FB0D|nr:hypothetical protein [Glycomyces sp. YM15]
MAVDEAEAAEFADPPRKWGRVGAMAGAWAIVVALGGWVAPSFAESGNPANVDPRDEAASSANNAAWRYLRYGSNQDLERAEATLCEGASPELTPSDLDAIRQAYDAELGGITRVDLETGDPVPGVDGTTVAGTVSYIHEATQRFEEFVITVQEDDGAFCVSNAVRVGGEEPGSGDDLGEVVDPEAVAADFMRAIVVEREPGSAAAPHCAANTGVTPEEIDAAISEWAKANGEFTAFIDTIEPAESSETSITAFTFEISLKASLNQETFSFTVAVQEGCVTMISGGDGLI